MSDIIKFAVVGCGHIGKRYIETIRNAENAELVAVADTGDQSSLNLPENGFLFFQSLEELLQADVEIDVVAIATPNGFHYEQTLQVLQSGKHAVVEKPMTLKRDKAEEIIALARQKNLQVFPVMQNRFAPVSVWIKEIVESGILGDIYMVQVNCFWNRDERYYTPGSWHGTAELDGGTLYTQFSHFIDMVYWLFGDFAHIDARMNNFNHQDVTEFEDSGNIHLDFASGGTGNINFTTSVWGANLESSLTVIAENGSVKIGGQYMEKVEACKIKGYEFTELVPAEKTNHLAMISKVVKNLLINGDSDYSEAMESVKVIDIIERIYAAAKKPEQIPDPM